MKGSRELLTLKSFLVSFAFLLFFSFFFCLIFPRGFIWQIKCWENFYFSVHSISWFSPLGIFFCLSREDMKFNARFYKDIGFWFKILNDKQMTIKANGMEIENRFCCPPFLLCGILVSSGKFFSFIQTSFHILCALLARFDLRIYMWTIVLSNVGQSMAMKSNPASMEIELNFSSRLENLFCRLTDDRNSEQRFDANSMKWSFLRTFCLSFVVNQAMVEVKFALSLNIFRIE